MKKLKSFGDKLKIAAVTGLCMINFSVADAGELLAQIDADLKGDGNSYTVKLEGNRLVEKGNYFRDLMLVVKDSEGHMRSAWKPNLDGAYNCILAKIPEPKLNSKKESVVLIAGQGGAENLPVWRIIDFGKDGNVKEIFSAEDSLGLTVNADYAADRTFIVECESPLTNSAVLLQGKADNVYGVFDEAGEPVKTYLKPVISPVISLVEDAERQNVLHAVQQVYAADLHTELGKISYELLLKEVILPDGTEKLMWMPDNIVLHEKTSVEDAAEEEDATEDVAASSEDKVNENKATSGEKAKKDVAAPDEETSNDAEEKSAAVAEDKAEDDEKIVYNGPAAAGNWQLYSISRYDEKGNCISYPVVSVEGEPELQNKINEQLDKWRTEGAFSAEAKYRVAFSGEQLMSLVCFRKDVDDDAVKTDVAIFNFDMRTGKNVSLKDMFDLKNKDFKEVLNLAGKPEGAFEKGNAAVWFYDGEDFYFADKAEHIVETDKLWVTATDSVEEEKTKTPTKEENVYKALEIMGENASKLQTEAVKDTIMHAADSQMQEIADAMERMEKAKADRPELDSEGNIIPYTKVNAADMYVFVKDKSMPAHPEKEDAATEKLEAIQKALQEDDEKSSDADGEKAKKS